MKCRVFKGVIITTSYCYHQVLGDSRQTAFPSRGYTLLNKMGYHIAKVDVLWGFRIRYVSSAKSWNHNFKPLEKQDQQMLEYIGRAKNERAHKILRSV